MFSVSENKKDPIRGIDPKYIGNHCRFFNHSCRPNSVFEAWVAEDKWMLKFRTKAAIAKGTELMIDYKWNKKQQECFCGESNCKRLM